jgi:hypothetical protein
VPPRKRACAPALDTSNVIEPVRTVTIPDCIAACRSRAGKLRRFNVRGLDELDAVIGSAT